MATKDNDRCREKADRLDLERFTLIPTDPTAGPSIIGWIKDNFWNRDEAKLREAFECALRMKDQHLILQQETAPEDLPGVFDEQG